MGARRTQDVDRDSLEAYAALQKHGTIAAAARALGIPRSTLVYRCEYAQRLMAEGKLTPDNKVKTEEEKTAESREDVLLNRVFELEAQLRAVRQSTLTDEYVRQKIIGLTEQINAAQAPPWRITPQLGGQSPGVPMMIWSDWHWGEQVFAEQIGGVNRFDLDVAHERAKRLVEKTIYLLREHIVQPEYPGVVINLGGDMMSGDIHDELSQTNALPMMPCILDLFSVLRWAIGAMAAEFGNVFLPCVCGNHGRTTHKPRAKDRAMTNFDWLLYQFLAKSFEDDKRVQFMIPDGPDALYRVFGHRFLLTHGDQFRGGDGMIGHMGPVIRGRQKKLTRNAAVGQQFDTMLHGHFHQYSPTPRIIGNGSLKGYDEYAAVNNFSFEIPIQALWLCHYEHGIIQHLPVHLEALPEREVELDWIGWTDPAQGAA